MSNIFSKFGGKVKYTPEKVKSDLVESAYKDNDQIKNLALQRDLVAANLLENDILLDMLDNAIDEQMKEMALVAPELKEAIASFCGGEVITWECYKKAKELMRIAPWITNGYDPVQLTFTDKFTKRAGNVVFDCKQFDPNTFFETKETADIASIDPNATADDNLISPSEIEKKAQNNQKKWSLLILFWDLLWGKPEVRKLALLPGSTTDMTLEDTIVEITRLRSIGKTEEADNLANKMVASQNLPNLVMLERPKNADELMWQGSNGPIEHVTRTGENVVLQDTTLGLTSGSEPWNSETIAIWLEPASMFERRDRYKDRGVPAIKSGFILGILVGFLSLVPKLCFYFIKLRLGFLKSIRWLYTYKLFGVRIFKGVYEALKLLISTIIAPLVAISNVFIEACIWLAMHPHIYTPNISDDPTVAKKGNILTGINTNMIVEETPAGFVSLDCLSYAQDIVNRVNQEVN